MGNNHYLFILFFNFDILFLLLVLCFVSLLCMWKAVQKRPKLTGLKKKPNECHEFFLSSDGGKCSAISRSQGTSVPQTKRSWTNDDVLVKMLCKRMRSWTLNFNLNNSILVSFDINLNIFYFQWLSSALLLFLMTFHLLIQGPKWRKTDLTWKITKYTRQLDQSKTRYI